MSAKLPYPTGPAREAIVFLPGLSQEGPEESAEVIARRFAVALQDKNPDPGTSFAVEAATGQEAYGGPKGYHTPVCSIVKQGAGRKEPVIDLYRMTYADSLMGNFQQSSLLRQCWVLLGVLIRLLPRWFAFVFRRKSGTSGRQQVQVILSAIWLGLACVYTAMLLGTAVQTVIDLVPEVKAWVSQIPLFQGWSDWATNLPRALVLCFTVALTFVPKVRAQLAQSAVRFVSFARYFSEGYGRPVLIEQFKYLLGLVRGKGYDRVHVVAYSMGSAVALDSLFPVEDAAAGACTGIDTLVTIGCPFDMVQHTYWGGYYGERHVMADTPRRWINVYSPIDILGSNFRTDEQTGPATVGITARGTDPNQPGAPFRGPDPDANVPYRDRGYQSDTRLADVIRLVGFRSHTRYWDGVGESDFSCFSVVVPAMYDLPAAAH